MLQGLETGSREFCSHVIRNNEIVYVFQTPLNPDHAVFSAEHAKHGDGVKDVAFTVDDAAGIYEKAVSRGATSVRAPETLEDENGTMIVASVKTSGDPIHTFVQRDKYNGTFMPGFKEHQIGCKQIQLYMG